MSNSVKCGISCLFATFFIFLLLPITARAEEIAPPERYGRETLKSNTDYSDLVQVYDDLANNYTLATEDTNSYKVTLTEAYSYKTNPAYEAKYAVEVYKFDYPEHFWLKAGNGLTPNSDDMTITKISLNFDPGLYAQKSVFDSTVQEIMDSLGLTSEMSEYDRAKAVHDKLIELVEYNADSENASNAYGAIVGGAADSSGYAKAYQYLLYKAGIQAGIAAGILKESGEAVSWNFVRIDGEYYYTDVSADDGGGVVSYKYFNVTTAHMEEEREIDTPDYVPLPVCTATDAAYKGEDAEHEHEHVYDRKVEDEKYIKSALCGEHAVYYMSCFCGAASETEVFISETVLSHSFTDYVYNGDATCLKDGTETAECSRCKTKDTRTAPGTKLGHVFEYVYNNDATCFANGTKTPKCRICGTVDETGTTEAEGTRLEHSFTSYVYNNDATCINDGTETAVCDNIGCDETHTRIKEGSITEHSYVSNGTKEPTCTEDGYTLYVCSTKGCSEYYIGNIVEATGHSGGKATCKEQAVCETCGLKYGELAEHQYDMESWVYEDSTGHWHECKNCGARTTPEAHAKGPEATEETPQICTVCGYVIKPAIEHEHRLTKVPAKQSTCTEPGNIEYYTCSCGAWFADADGKTEIIDKSAVALGMKEHSFTNYVSNKNATCTSDGTETAKCDYCPAVDTRVEERSMLPHDFEIMVVKPGCIEGGFTKYSCKNCFYTYTADKTEPLGHDYDSTVTEPTCTEGGFTTHICSRCKDKYTDSVTTMLGHDWAEATCTVPKICRRCKEEFGLAAGHQASEWQTNQFEHWKFCTKENCREVIPLTWGTHSDGDYDGACDVCGYAFPEIYTVVNGGNEILENVRSNIELLLVVNADASKLTSVLVDGEPVLRVFYTVSPGSTEVRFSGEYLQTLSIGTHTVKFIYTDGIACAEFEIKSIGAQPKEEERPVGKYTEIIIENDSEEINPSTGADIKVLAPLFGAAAAAIINR